MPSAAELLALAKIVETRDTGMTVPRTKVKLYAEALRALARELGRKK
ncbi:MAG: hypothetical protein K2Y56_13225 [Methylobacterium sp.]|nr:hypothetical protein [Methylobacterium sp.]MBX9932481.1 hypothetical protein [Methylobacterium sp.]